MSIVMHERTRGGDRGSVLVTNSLTRCYNLRSNLHAAELIWSGAGPGDPELITLKVYAAFVALMSSSMIA